jgi:hypothetical protein
MLVINPMSFPSNVENSIAINMMQIIPTKVAITVMMFFPIV